MLLDIGAGELLAIVVLVAIVLGPEKLPDLTRKVLRVIHFIRRIANTATDQIKAELGPELADLDVFDPKPGNLVGQVLSTDTTNELTSMRQEMDAMRTEMMRLRLTAGTSSRVPLIAPRPAQAPPAPVPATET